MATTVMNVPAGASQRVLHTRLGTYPVVSGQVTVDSRLVRDLMKAGYTAPSVNTDMSDTSPTKTIVMTAPAGVTEVHHDGKKYVVSGGTVTVPRTAIEPLVAAGFTV